MRLTLCRDDLRLLLRYRRLIIRSASGYDSWVLDQNLRYQDLNSLISKEIPQQASLILLFELCQGDLLVQVWISQLVGSDLGSLHILEHGQCLALAKFPLHITKMLHEVLKEWFYCLLWYYRRASILPIGTVGIVPGLLHHPVVSLLVLHEFALHLFLEENLVAEALNDIHLSLTVIAEVTLHLSTEVIWLQIMSQ